jgi:hypothetical protein
MTRWNVVFFFHDESGSMWEDEATDAEDAEAQATEYFFDGGNGPLAGLTRGERESPEEIPAEGEYFVQITEQAR